MQIYISRNQQQLGPYSVPETRSRIMNGQLTGGDLAWHAGLIAWITLSEILAALPSPLQTPRPAPPPEISLFAWGSFIGSIVGAIGWIIFIVLAVMVSEKKEDDLAMAAVGLFTIGGLVLNILGGIAAILALNKPCTNKWMAITGLIFNG